jgi:hypothetical protein
MSSSIKHASNATEVHLHEDKLFVQLGDWKDFEAECTRWILDSGATKHMTGSRSAFADLDEAIRGTVCFGDGSVVGIVGKGTVVVECKNNEQRKLARVYLIPKLKANILNLGQLDEDDY